MLFPLLLHLSPNLSPKRFQVHAYAMKIRFERNDFFSSTFSLCVPFGLFGFFHVQPFPSQRLHVQTAADNESGRFRGERLCSFRARSGELRRWQNFINFE